MGDMTATEELRRMLDERGVEYDTRDGKAIKNTYWNDVEKRRWGYTSDESGVIKERQLFLVCGRMDLTPAQAITATLGAGTCHITDNGTWSYPYVCSACGASFDPDVNNGEFNHCPNCGRKVVDE